MTFDPRIRIVTTLTFEQDTSGNWSIDQEISEDTAFDLIGFLWSRLSSSTREEIASIAFRELDYNRALALSEEVFGNGAGQPPAPLFGYMDQAKSWVAFAEPKEVEAYFWECFKKMPKKRQIEFLGYAQKALA